MYIFQNIFESLIPLKSLENKKKRKIKKNKTLTPEQPQSLSFIGCTSENVW